LYLLLGISAKVKLSPAKPRLPQQYVAAGKTAVACPAMPFDGTEFFWHRRPDGYTMRGGKYVCL